MSGQLNWWFMLSYCLWHATTHATNTLQQQRRLPFWNDLFILVLQRARHTHSHTHPHIRSFALVDTFFYFPFVGFINHNTDLSSLTGLMRTDGDESFRFGVESGRVSCFQTKQFCNLIANRWQGKYYRHKVGSKCINNLHNTSKMPELPSASVNTLSRCCRYWQTRRHAYGMRTSKGVAMQ